MGRSRRAAPRRAAPRAPAPRAAPAPARQAPAQPPAKQQGGGMLAGMAGTIAQGFAFGTGSAMAHRAVGAAADAMTGGGGGEQQAQAPMQAQSKASCEMDEQNFKQCIQDNGGDITSCSFLFDALKSCQMDNKSQFA